jgi:hypothetical protein
MKLGYARFCIRLFSTTPGAVNRRLLLQFHTAQNSASSGPNPIAGQVLKKVHCRVKAPAGFIVCIRRRWGKAR